MSTGERRGWSVGDHSWEAYKHQLHLQTLIPTMSSGKSNCIRSTLYGTQNIFQLGQLGREVEQPSNPSLFRLDAMVKGQLSAVLMAHRSNFRSKDSHSFSLPICYDLLLSLGFVADLGTRFIGLRQGGAGRTMKRALRKWSCFDRTWYEAMKSWNGWHDANTGRQILLWALLPLRHSITSKSLCHDTKSDLCQCVSGQYNSLQLISGQLLFQGLRSTTQDLLSYPWCQLYAHEACFDG